MKTQAEWDAWLNDPTARRVVLLETSAGMGGVETSIYMSAGTDFTSSASDAAPHVTYLGIASIDVLFTEEMTLPRPGVTPGGGRLSAGAIRISNPNGERDGWADYAWLNRKFIGLAGSPDWNRDDFRVIFDGTTAGFTQDGESYYTLTLGDKLQRVNAPITEAKLGGTTNSDALLPQGFGEIHNAAPLLIDAGTGQYMYNNGRVQSTTTNGVTSGAIEARVRGAPVDIDNDPMTGTFRLRVNNQGGEVTVSFKGDAPAGVYSNKIGAIIRRILTGFGKSSDRLTDADLDLPSFTQFDTANPQPVGLWVGERLNTVDACQQLADSVAAEVVAAPSGLIRLVQLRLPATSPTATITPSSIVDKSFKPVGILPPLAGASLNFCRNWTGQAGLETALPEEHKNLFAKEWLNETDVDEAARAAHRLTGAPAERNTLLLRRADAAPEAARQKDLWKVPRKMYQLIVERDQLGLTLGQEVTVFHHRYGFQAGANAVIIARAVDWATLRTTLRIIL